MSHPSAFKTPEGEARYLAAYDAALKLWPVPCDEIDIPTRFGTTHVVVSGPKDASPLVLLHGYMATSVMWSPNIIDFSQHYRVYAIDTMGQPSKSIPSEPIRDAVDYVTLLYDASTALARARRLIPDFEGELVPGCRHDMCFSQHRIVDARVLNFLKRAKAEREDHPPERVVA